MQAQQIPVQRQHSLARHLVIVGLFITVWWLGFVWVIANIVTHWPPPSPGTLRVLTAEPQPSGAVLYRMFDAATKTCDLLVLSNTGGVNLVTPGNTDEATCRTIVVKEATTAADSGK